MVVVSMALGWGGGKIHEVFGGQPGEEIGSRSQRSAVSTIGLSPTGSCTETVYVFPALMSRYDHKQIYKSGAVPVRFRRYDKREIQRGGTITFEVKLRGNEVGVVAFQVNGKTVWKYWRFSTSPRNIRRAFSIGAGSEVRVGAHSGQVEYVQFRPNGSHRPNNS
jgi:hypothetical protein